MSEIQTSNWSETASSNNASPPDGFPEGQTAASLNNCAREMMAALKREWNRSHYTIDAGGTGDAMTLTYTTAPPALVQGMRFQFQTPSTTNTAADPTIDVNSLGTKTLVLANTYAVSPGQLPTDTIIDVVYDGTEFRLVSNSIYGPTSVTGATIYYANGTAEEMGRSATVNGVKTVSFAVAFGSIINVQITPSGGAGAGAISPLYSGTLSAGGMMVYGDPTESFGFHWRVVGFV